MKNDELYNDRLQKLEKQNEELLNILKSMRRSIDQIKNDTRDINKTDGLQYPYMGFDNYMFPSYQFMSPSSPPAFKEFKEPIKRSKSTDNIKTSKKIFKRVEETIDLSDATLTEIVGYLKANTNNQFNPTTISATLQRVQNELFDLDGMIGIDNLKNYILDYIFFCINMYDSEKDHNINLVLCGEPGVGKTTVAYIIAKILSRLGIVDDVVIPIVASELIGSHVGETAKNTISMINSAPGGVVIIDEVYAVGGVDNAKDFSSEFCNALIGEMERQKNVPFEQKKIFMLIGYEKEIVNRILKNNRGVRSRFPHIFRIENYNDEILFKIFINKVQSNKFHLTDDAIKMSKNIFKQFKSFPSNGRGIDNLITELKMILARRVDRNKDIDAKTIQMVFDRFRKKIEKCSDIEDDVQINQHIESMYC